MNMFDLIVDMTRMIKRTVSLVVAFLTVVQCCSAANILILGMPYYSHLAGMANVGKFLQRQGHDVRIAIPPQLKEKVERHGVELLLYHCLGDYPEDRFLQDLMLKIYFETDTFLHSLFYTKGADAIQMGNNVLTKIVRDTSLRENIEKFKPDLIILDSSPIAIMLTLIPYKLDIPYVMVGSTTSPQCKRSPILPTVFPHTFLPYTDHMTFLQRMLNTYVHLRMYRQSPFINSSLLYEYVPEKPYISPVDLQAKALLWISRQYGVLDYNPPTMPNVKRVAHLNTLTTKALPPEFQSFVESADNGVVIVSFGSIFGMPEPRVQQVQVHPLPFVFTGF